MKPTRLSTLFFAALLLPAATLVSAHGDDSTTTLKFSDPSKPGTLKVAIAGGKVTITGADVPDVRVRSNARPADEHRDDGLRVLTSSTGFMLKEKGNVMTIDFPGGAHHGRGEAQFDITVPKSTSVVLSSMYGDTACSDVNGDVEIRNNSGRVDLKGLGGGASVETMNGPIHVAVRELEAGHPLSFTSMNGEVVIRLPKDAKANLQLRTQNGSILTDFSEEELVSNATAGGPGVAPRPAGSDDDDNGAILSEKERETIRQSARQVAAAARQAAEAIRDAARATQEGIAEGTGQSVPPLPPLPPLPSMSGGKTVSGVLHGGGPEIQATTMNGDVVVRKEP